MVYYHGQPEAYHDQFYGPYQDYPAPIFAIPGNHDGDTEKPDETLGPFLNHFCAAEASHAAEAGHSDRPTMVQPNCYWRLDTPLATIIGSPEVARTTVQRFADAGVDELVLHVGRGVDEDRGFALRRALA